jgi:hypothetical protein
MASNRSNSTLKSIIQFDAIATGVPAAAIALLSNRFLPTSNLIGPFLGLDANYVSIKCGILSLYGGLVYLGIRKTAPDSGPPVPSWITNAAAICNIVFAAESVMKCISVRQEGTLTFWGEQMLVSTAVGGLIFPLLFMYYQYK